EEKDYEKVQNEDYSNPPTKKELIGWYFHNLGVSVFIPFFYECAKHSGASSAEIKALEDKIATQLSSYSMVADFTGGLVVLIAGLGILLAMNDLTDSI
ncbi:2247_t:CDS:2, partial [Racocetra fulgida]